LTPRSSDDGTSEARAAVARLQGLRARRTSTSTQIVLPGMEHDAPSVEGRQFHARNRDLRTNVSRRVGRDVAQISRVAIGSARTSVVSVMGIEVRPAPFARVASDVSALMHV
jgi:hypothetical protein